MGVSEKNFRAPNLQIIVSDIPDSGVESVETSEIVIEQA